ncbi:hypothetical protein NBRC110019_31810 [Neptunitalea chrysea]|uniref:T9SS type A sorting domain-containing protein n=1 Tax=Neptunitalea chrysea TaxID=1647581 RepID=A0A9W6EV04_9FLAO|nr:T9SS type A sorting domain-containing protein [Neptunitalea chrysea]GLB54140.1 hypothetical protein NBRC110019_31810 [Neptunitalea chrysea]
MKKTTLLIFTLLVCSFSFAQVLNQSANWPNTNWTLSGTYSSTYLISDPTTSANFSFNDDAAGSSSYNDVAAESPTIDLTTAYTAGETWIYFTAPYVYTEYPGASITVEYWDADAATWNTWINPFNTSTTGAPNSDFCSGTFENLDSDALNIYSFTATQLSGFKYRVYFDDGDAYSWGFCFSSPTIYSTTPPSCPDPSLLYADNISYDSASIGWTENGSATKWNVQYGVSPYTFDPAAGFATTTNPTGLTALTGNTTYEVYVQADCGGGDTSNWIGPIYFTTLCPPITAPYTEGFENGGTIPSCWTQDASNDEDWIFDTNGDHIGNYGTVSGTTATGGYLAYIDNSLPHYTGITLTTPLVDISTLTTPGLSFYLLSDNEGYTNVDFSIDFFDGTNWNTSIYTSNTNKTSWSKIYIDLSSYTISGPVQVKFIVDENNGSDYYDDIAIDDVTFDELPACVESSDITAYEVLDTTALISLVQAGTVSGWNIEYGAPGFTQGTGTTVTATAMPYTLASLTTETDYEFYLQTDCGGGDTSVWQGPFSFTTLCAPYTAPYTEDFENAGAIPTCWLQGADNTEDWIFDTTADAVGPGTSTSGGYFAYVDDSWPEGTGTTLYTPLVDVSTLTSPALTFFYNNDNDALGNGQFSVDFFDGATWHTDVFTTNTDTAGWQLTAIDLTTYTITGAVRARFVVDELGYYENDIALDDVSFDEFPSCLPAMNLTATDVLTTSATLDWTTLGSSTSWIIEYGYEGFTLGTGTQVTTSSAPYTVSALDPTTEYDYYILSDCSSGTSVWVGPYTFKTTCAIYNTPYVENFENGGAIPDCWTQTSGNAENWLFTDDTSWTSIGNDGIITGSTSSNGYMAYVDDSWPDSASTGLETPMVDVSGLATPSLIFYLISDNQGYTNVDFSVDFYDGAAWHTGIYTSNSNTNGWQLVTIDLSSYSITGPVQARFVVAETNGSDYYDDVAIDDVVFDELPNCEIPSNFYVDNITTYSADFFWTENGSASNWNIEWGPTGFTQGTGTLINTADNPITIEDFVAGTEYDIYVQADCGSSTSLWVGPLTFTTQCNPFGDFVETFDTTATGDIPLCWSKIEDTTSIYAYVEIESWTPNSSPNNLTMYNSDDINAGLYLITPKLTDLPNGTHRAKFFAQGSSWATYSIEVGTMSDYTDPTTFTPVTTIDLTGTYTQYTVDFDTPTTDSYVAIKHASTATYQTIYIDDFIWTAIPTTAPACATNVLATPDPSCGNYNSEIAWDLSTDADGYYLSVGTTSGGTDVLSNVDLGYTNGYTLPGDFNTTYYYTVTPYNSFGMATGCTEYSFTTATNGCYCISVPTSVDGQGITDVVIDSTPFTNDGSTYNDFTATVVTMYADILNNVQITYDANSYSYNTGIYIDFDDDYNFETGENVFLGASAAAAPTTLDASFVMPAGASGQHLMRINGVWSNSSDPCYNDSYGVTLDFMVDITAASCTPVAIGSTSITHDCSASSFTVDVDVTALGDGTPSITDGTTTWPLSSTGIATVGPFPYGTDVTLTALHGVTDICNTPVGTFSYDVCPPTNDDLCGAISLPLVTPATVGNVTGSDYTTEGSTSQTDEPMPSCFQDGLNGSVWFSFVAPNDGAVQVTTDYTGGTSTDTEIAVYSASGVNCLNLNTLGTPVGCDQDSGTNEGWNSIINFNDFENPLLIAGETYYVQVDSYGDSSIGSFSIEVIDLPTASTEFFDNTNFRYYPNPVNNNILNLNSEQTINAVNVSNVLGQTVMKLVPNTLNYVVDMTELSSGTYFVEVQIGDTAKTVKIIKE